MYVFTHVDAELRSRAHMRASECHSTHAAGAACVLLQQVCMHLYRFIGQHVRDDGGS